jgi:uncharacterized protein (TIGR02453 family)
MARTAKVAADKSAKLVFPDDFRPDFEGFRPAAFKFLRGLAGHNERAWFAERREIYDTELKFPMECLVAEFRDDAAGNGLPVRGDAKKSMFRLHRDVRFAKDKSPYKTHVGAILSRGGARSEPGVVYIHIQPGNCFVSAGFWRLDKEPLAAWRQRMAENPDEWLAIAGDYTDPDGAVFMRAISALKTMPRGFRDHADSPVAEFIRWKSYLMTRNVSDAEVSDRGLVGIIRDHALLAVPLLNYGWEIVDSPADDDPRRHLRGQARPDRPHQGRK